MTIAPLPNSNSLPDIAQFHFVDTHAGERAGRYNRRKQANGPAEAAIDPAGLCLYVTNFGDTADSVSRYSINEHNGVATSLGTTPTGENPLGIAIAPF